MSKIWSIDRDVSVMKCLKSLGVLCMKSLLFTTHKISIVDDARNLLDALLVTRCDVVQNRLVHPSVLWAITSRSGPARHFTTTA